MEQVRRMIEVGVGAGAAVRQVLGDLPQPLTIEAFADKHGLNSSAVSAAINCSVRPTEAVVEALASELGGTPFGWRMLLWEAARPKESVAAAV